jgi:hypothetical protein
MTIGPATNRTPDDSQFPAPTWRAAIAALANDDLRAEYARIVLAQEPAQPRRVSRLVRAGLVEVRDGKAMPATARLRSMLAEWPNERPQRGLGRFLRSDGSIERYPSQQSERVELLRFVAAEVIQADEQLPEAELNDRLKRFHDDTALLRRYLVDYGVLDRTASGSEYRRHRTEGSEPLSH